MLAAIGMLVAIASAAGARADAVPGPPDDCAPGSVGESDHSGPWCMPTECQTDADCAPDRQGGGQGFVCHVASLCLLTQTLSVGGQAILENPGATYERTSANGPCPADRACEDGALCQTTKRCMAASAVATLPPPATGHGATQPPGVASTHRQPSGGCASCSLAGEHGEGTLVALAIAGLAIVVAWRRARHTR